MKLLRQKIFFEATEDIKKTKENLREVKDKVVSSAKDLIENPGKVVDKVKRTGKNTIRIIKSPKLAGRVAKSTGRKAWEFIKKNPRDAAYLVAADTLPIAVGKIVADKKGEEAGVAAAGITTALPIGEVAIGIDHLSRSESGKTAFRAARDVIKGSMSDLGNIIIKRRKLK